MFAHDKESGLPRRDRRAGGHKAIDRNTQAHKSDILLAILWTHYGLTNEVIIATAETIR